MKKLILALIVLATWNCSKDQDYTYFGGEIVNPKHDYVYLFMEEEAIDSAKINADNRFQFALSKIKEGLYTFRHGREYQYIVLEKGDSLMLRLNTMDFDESMIFSGEGSVKNNFLIDMYLVNEDEVLLIKKLQKTTPDIFERKLDSMHAMKMVEYDEFVDEANPSDLANHVALAAINYPYYTARELYAISYKFWHGLKSIPELREGFYDYRKDVNVNDEVLTAYVPYYIFLNRYLDNLTVAQCNEKCQMGGKWSAYHYGTHKLNLVDSVVTHKGLRSSLFETTAIKYFQLEHDRENNEKFISFYRGISDTKHSGDIDVVYKAINNLRAGATFPVLSLFDTAGVEHKLDSAWYDQKTVFYLWNTDKKAHARATLRHMEKMAVDYPDFRFVGINMDDDHQTWLTALNELNATNTSQSMQLRAPNMEYIMKHLAYFKLNRMLVINKNGTVIEGFGNIYNVTPLEYQNARQELVQDSEGL